MNEAPQLLGTPRPVELFSLPQNERALERVRLVNGMRIDKVGEPEQPAWPIDLVGDAEQAAAFLDLVYQTSLPDRLGVIISDGTSLMADKSLVAKLNGGVLPVRQRYGETTVVYIEQDKQTGKYHCRYGYSARGTSVQRDYGNNINVNIGNDPDVITDESLYRLYRLTGNPSYSEILGIRAELKGRGAASAQSKTIDPEGYYAALGLNPYASRFLDEDLFSTLVNGMKRKVAMRLHPDAAHPRKTELAYLKRMFAACEVLEDKAKRERYSTWLND